MSRSRKDRGLPPDWSNWSQERFDSESDKIVLGSRAQVRLAWRAQDGLADTDLLMHSRSAWVRYRYDQLSMLLECEHDVSTRSPFTHAEAVEYGALCLELEALHEGSDALLAAGTGYTSASDGGVREAS